MADDHIILMGTKGGPAIRPGSSMPTSSLVCLHGRTIVLDCGLGVTRGLCDAGMSLKDLTTIIISHLHSDHYIELGPLMHTAWMAGLNAPVTVWGPQGLADYWHHFCQSMTADIDLRIEDEGRIDLRSLLNIHVLEEGHVCDDNGVLIHALRNVHPPLEQTYALSFQSAKHQVVFSGDTAPFDALDGFVRNADLLIHEAMLTAPLDDLMARIGNVDERLMAHFRRSHTKAEDVAALASRAGVKALALHHLLPADDSNITAEDWERAVRPHYNGPLYIGHDGLKIDLPG
ncbi:MAG: MBL fold metallo-hydrolase [Pseudomonadota bacterium]